MPTASGGSAILPLEQQRVRDKCYQPTGTFVPFPKEAIEQSIPEQFEQQVRLHPDRLAVQDQREALTYTELNAYANQIAQADSGTVARLLTEVEALADDDAHLADERMSGA